MSGASLRPTFNVISEHPHDPTAKHSKMPGVPLKSKHLLACEHIILQALPDVDHMWCRTHLTVANRPTMDSTCLHRDQRPCKLDMPEASMCNQSAKALTGVGAHLSSTSGWVLIEVHNHIVAAQQLPTPHHGEPIFTNMFQSGLLAWQQNIFQAPEARIVQCF